MIETAKEKFLSPSTLSAKIEEMVLLEGYTYFEAIVDFAAEADKSPDELVPHMSKVLLDKVRKSACDSGFFQQQSMSLEDFESDENANTIEGI